MNSLTIEQRKPTELMRLKDDYLQDLYDLYQKFNSTPEVSVLNESDFFASLRDPNTQVGDAVLRNNLYWDSKIATAELDGELVGFMQHANNASGTKKQIVAKRAMSAVHRLGVSKAPNKVYRTIIARGVEIDKNLSLDPYEIMRNLIGHVALNATHNTQNMTIYEHLSAAFSDDRATIEGCGFEILGITPSDQGINPLIAYRASATQVREACREV